MAAVVRLSAGVRATTLQTASVLRSYLYDAGTWNNKKPFHYDLEEDPAGRQIFNKLLPNYLATKKGNCVSMPTLFVLLAQKLGLEATFAQTPNHLFVKYRDELYLRDTPMTQLALKNGTYMRPLSKKESIVAAMVSVLTDHYKEQVKPERVIAFDEVALVHDEYKF